LADDDEDDENDDEDDDEDADARGGDAFDAAGFAFLPRRFGAECGSSRETKPN
jgi:hypothetical protein